MSLPTCEWDDIQGAKPRLAKKSSKRTVSELEFKMGILVEDKTERAQPVAAQVAAQMAQEIKETKMEQSSIGDWNWMTHNGAVTMHNPSTGQHRTIIISTQAEDANFAPGERIISLKTGPEWFETKGFGFVKPNGIIVWKKNRGTVMETYADMIQNPAKWEAKGVEFLAEGRCIRCNRPLTHPDSIKNGIGPVCAEKM